MSASLGQFRSATFSSAPRGSASRPQHESRIVLAVWLLAGLAVFLGGLRVGLNLQTPNGVIDVGYAGVIGADRILDHQAPYGHMPDTAGRACGPADTDGAIRDHIQKNGRCESANGSGDTYAPPGTSSTSRRCSCSVVGQVDSLPAAHATAIAFDLLVVLGLLLVVRRSADTTRGRARIRLDRVPLHRLRAERELERQIMPAILVWGFWLATRAGARGATMALAGWTNFASLLLAPLC